MGASAQFIDIGQFKIMILVVVEAQTMGPTSDGGSEHEEIRQATKNKNFFKA